MEVVNIRKKELNKRGYKDFTEWNAQPDTLYIGRNMNFYVPGTHASKWANPFKTKSMPIEKSLQRYEDYIRGTPELYDALPELYGLTLGCWCKPNPCHGDVLLKLLRELNE